MDAVEKLSVCHQILGKFSLLSRLCSDFYTARFGYFWFARVSTNSVSGADLGQTILDFRSTILD
jgi:hypothetical protein